MAQLLRSRASVVREMRATRQRRRLGDTEWFDVAYRVYLFALVGAIVVITASDAIDGLIGDDVTADDLVGRGPALAGVAVAVAFGLGLRSGADGGPISIEVADIRHVLLAPVSRVAVMRRPIVQRFRASMFSLALACAVLGQLVAREVVGSRAAWAGAGVVFGAIVGATFTASAIISHAARVPRWLATMLAAAVLAWQGIAAFNTWRAIDGVESIPTWQQFGPANLAGSVAFWGVRQRGIDVIFIAAVVAAAIVAILVGGRLRIEPLTRRAQLVSQLRFAATVQDLRTVVMLRRQLRAETLRTTPWGGQRTTRSVSPRGAPHLAATGQPADASLIWRRGLRSLLRLPASRVGRIAALAVAAGVTGSLAASASPIFLAGTLAALFLLGMETIEPLSQEIDRPDITDSLPVDRGWLYVHHLVAPAVLLVAAAIIGAVAASIVEPQHAAAAFAIAVPVAWAGAIGPVIGAVLDAAPPVSNAGLGMTGKPTDTASREVSMMPPEFAGASNAISTFMPVVVSALGLLPIVAMNAAATPGTAMRIVVGLTLVLALLISWVRRRDRWAAKIRSFFEAGRAEQSSALNGQT